MKRKAVTEVAENGNGNGNGIMTLGEVAKKLKVSTTWIYKKCKAGILPHVKIGGIIRIREADLRQWLEDHKVEGCEKV